MQTAAPRCCGHFQRRSRGFITDYAARCTLFINYLSVCLGPPWGCPRPAAPPAVRTWPHTVGPLSSHHAPQRQKRIHTQLSGETEKSRFLLMAKLLQYGGSLHRGKRSNVSSAAGTASHTLEPCSCEITAFSLGSLVVPSGLQCSSLEIAQRNSACSSLQYFLSPSRILPQFSKVILENFASSNAPFSASSEMTSFRRLKGIGTSPK